MASVYSSTPFERLTEAEWDRDLAANLKSAFLCSQAAVPLMRKGGGGRIVNFADWLAASGRPGYPGFTAYYVAKAGVIALTEALALELAADQILVNAIAPGPIVAPPDLSEAELQEVAAATPLGRWGGELEIAKAVDRADRHGLHHRRNDPRRRRPPRSLTQSPSQSSNPPCRSRRSPSMC